MNISKELLSEVLAYPIKIEYYNITYYGYGNKYIKFSWISSIDGTEVTDTINIYELDYKCKKWAYEKGFHMTYIYAGKYSTLVIEDVISEVSQQYDILTDVSPAGTFKACEHIYTTLLKDTK